ncbi:pirin family protein [Avibacterium avium]|uniref:pirin family protein n=1 Tax=Avibacterium avium TaxID=751 RepID=UPI003BF8924F
MKTLYHSADSRGNADHGWLKSRHTFSFANYYDPARIHFGALRVINDDYVEGGMGFGTHPHDNMEIISIPLSGDLAHKDSMGNGVYAFVLKGEATVAGQKLSTRDGLGVWDTENFDIVADSDTEILLMEAPMTV